MPHTSWPAQKKPSVFECILFYEKWSQVFAGVSLRRRGCAYYCICCYFCCLLFASIAKCATNIVNEMWCHQWNWYLKKWFYRKLNCGFTLYDVVIWLVGFRQCCVLCTLHRILKIGKAIWTVHSSVFCYSWFDSRWYINSSFHFCRVATQSALDFTTTF